MYLYLNISVDNGSKTAEAKLQNVSGNVRTTTQHKQTEDKMKNCFYILTTMILVLSSCAKPTEACFDFSPTNITTSTSVTFNATCTKHGGYSYEWNFGDGTPDTTLLGEPTVTHIFSSSGTYVITLKAGRKDGVVWKENNKYITKRTLTVQ